MRTADVVVDLFDRVRTLQKQGDNASIAAILSDPREWNGLSVTASASRALGQMKSAAAVPYLGRLINDSRFDVRVSVTKALGMIGVPECGPPLIEALRDDEEVVRQWATVGLTLPTAVWSVATLAFFLRVVRADWVRVPAEAYAERLIGAAELVGRESNVRNTALPGSQPD